MTIDLTRQVIAYHFTGATLRDGRPIPAVGEILRHDGPIEWCKSGLYASLKPHQAVRYAPGTMLHMVECSRIWKRSNAKFVCRKRIIRKSFDATYLMRRFAADQALSVADLWDMPEVVFEYLTTLDESKRNESKKDAAKAAAASAAMFPARAAPWYATTFPAFWAADAALSAVEDSVLQATRFSVLSAAWANGRTNASAKQWENFNTRVYAAFEEIA